MTEKAFLAAIAAEPAGAAHWSAYADWLEDQGRPGLAHAARWVLRARCRPLHCPGDGVRPWKWLRRREYESQKVPRWPKSWGASLPCVIFDRLKEGRALHGRATREYRTLGRSLRGLAAALQALRAMTEA